MDKKPRFFIYDRKEVAVLVLLGVMVAVFAFTLGVHLGKRAGGKLFAPSVADSAPKGVEPAQEAAPSEEEIEKRMKLKHPPAEDLVNQETQAEVDQSGMRLDSPRQVQLPTEAAPPVSRKVVKPAAAPPAADKSAPEPAETKNPTSRRYSVQIGSYPSLLVAQAKAHDFEGLGMKPFVHKAAIKGIGVRFRILVGEYPTWRSAERAGALLKAESKVDAFVVTKIDE